jgi:hypothetical protein
MALRKPSPTRATPSMMSGRPSSYEDVPPPPLPERMRARDSSPVDADDVNGLRDALRAAGVREVQLINLTRTQIESVDKLQETFAKVAESIPKLDASITRLVDLLGAGAVPATRGAYTDITPGGRLRDATPGGRKPTPAAGEPISDQKKAK